MDVVSICLFGIVFLLACYYVNRPRNLPPGPFALPILGSVGLIRLLRHKPMDKLIMDESRKYGPIIHCRILNTRAVILFGYDIIYQAFVKQADVFSDRPTWLHGMQEPLKHGKGLVWQNGEDLRLLRRLTLKSLRGTGVGTMTLEQKILLEVEEISRVLTKEKPADIRRLMSMAVTNVVYGITCGSRFDYNDEEFLKLIHKLEIIFSGTGNVSSNPISYLPAAMKRWLPIQAARKLVEKQASYDSVVDHFFTQIRQHKKTYDPEQIRDLIDLFLRKSSTDPTEGLFSDGNLCSTLMDLFIAGSETTFNTLSWAVLYMMEYWDVQSKCQAEIEKMCSHQPVSWSDRVKLPYVEATLLEIQRRANTVPGSVPHGTTVDTTLQGFHIPKGTVVFAILTSANMDPEYWHEPEAFRPERFLDDSGKTLRRDAFIPFSIGPRKCLGDTAARMQLFLIFANLLQRFTFLKEDSELPADFSPKLGQIMNAPMDYLAMTRNRT